MVGIVHGWSLNLLQPLKFYLSFKETNFLSQFSRRLLLPIYVIQGCPKNCKTSGWIVESKYVVKDAKLWNKIRRDIETALLFRSLENDTHFLT
jgi:hypothetical protein